MISINKVRNIKIEEYKRAILYIDKRCYKREVRFNEEVLEYLLTKDTTLYVVNKWNNINDKTHIVAYMMCYEDDNYFYLSSVAVLKKYRKEGLGKILFKKFLVEGRKYKTLRLHAINPIMVTMAERKGFKIIRRNKNYFGKVGALLMEKQNEQKRK